MEHSTTPGADATPRWHNWAVLAALIGAVAIVALAAFLRLEGMGRDGLWYDEVFSRGYAWRPLSHGRHWQNGMALYHAMMHVWVRIAGDSEAGLRHPSAALGVAAVALLIVLVRRVNGWPTALLAGLLLAISWKRVYYSQEARAYSLFIALSVLTTLLLVWLLENWSTRRLVIYGIALLALAYSHYQFVSSWCFTLLRCSSRAAA